MRALFVLMLKILPILVLFIGWIPGSSTELPPDLDQKFPLQVTVVNPHKLKLDWTIQPGYYLLKDKLQIQSRTPHITLLAPILPPAGQRKDEFFGEMAIYEQSLSIEVPLQHGGTAPVTTVQVAIAYQGCQMPSDCFPLRVLERTLDLANPGANPAEKSISPASNPLNAVVAQLHSNPFTAPNASLANTGEFMDPELAFQVSIIRAEPSAITLQWEVTPGYYLYQDKLKFSLAQAPTSVKLLTPVLPAGKLKEDEFFGKMLIYDAPFTVTLPLQGASGGDALSLALGYQGCAAAGICYPPQKKTLPVSLVQGALQKVVIPTTEPLSSPLDQEADHLTRALHQHHLGQVIFAFFGAGLLLAFTPCVFPMVPILSSLIAGQGRTITTQKAFLLSWVYVLAMALTYTIAGIITGLVGQNLQAVFQDPWIIAGFSLILVALALSCFGFYELQMPSALQSRLTQLSNRQAGGQWVGVAIMGFLSALIVGPCVAPPLAAALIYIGQSGDAVLGGLALFALSLGMGTPLLMIGTSAGRWLPRAGAWMNATKAVFGVILLAMAIMMLERIAPPALTLSAWAALFMVSAVYLGALEPLTPQGSGWLKLWKGVGIILLVYGVLILVAVLAGGGRFGVLQPLKDIVALPAGGRSVTDQAGHSSSVVAFQLVTDSASLQTALAQAKGKPVLLDFYATWCVECVRMERTTFSDPQLTAKAADWVFLKVDMTAYTPAHQALLKSLQLIGPPATLFFDTQGQERRDLRALGYLDIQAFLTRLQAVETAMETTQGVHP